MVSTAGGPGAAVPDTPAAAARTPAQLLRYALGLVVGIVVLALLFGRRGELVAAVRQLGSASPAWVAAAVGAESLSLLAYALLQRRVLRLAGARAASPLPGRAGLVALDTRVTAELAAEGTARDVVRVVQQARRDEGLSVSDRIRLTIGADAAVAEAVRAHARFVAAETLAERLDVRPAGDVDADPQPAGDGVVKVALTRASAAAT